jgi:hypothetical protein
MLTTVDTASQFVQEAREMPDWLSASVDMQK